MGKFSSILLVSKWLNGKAQVLNARRLGSKPYENKILKIKVVKSINEHFFISALIEGEGVL